MSTTKMVLEFLGCEFISSSIGAVCDQLVSWAASIIFSRKRKRDDGGVLLEKLKIKLMAVRPLLNDAEVKQWTDPAVKDWMDDIKHVLYQANDLQDEIATKAMQTKLDSEFPTTTTSSNTTTTTTTTTTSTHQDVTEGIELRIEAIIEKLEYFVNIAKDSLGLRQFDVVGRNNPPSYRLPLTSSLVDHDSVYGRDSDKVKIIQLLISEDDSNGHRVCVIPIVGMGGIGKTTLAQLVYNDPKVDNHFDKKSWVCVSEEFDIVRVTKSILEGLNINLQTSGDNLDTLQVKLKNGLAGNKFLIVLDDIWNENRNKWLQLSLPFGVGKHGSKIITTTRQKKVASIMLHDPIAPNPIIDLRGLSDEYCWQVFSKHAFGNASHILPPDKERISKKIVEKCKGLPLAATTLGGMFHELEIKEWERVLESHFWDLPKENCDILPALMLSYHHLPSHLKRCFAFCAIIPKDYIFRKHQLVPLWIALGFVEQPTDNRRIEDIGDGYFRELISRSLFQQSRDYHNDVRFLMHDLINDLAQFVAGKYCLSSDDGHPPDFSKVRYFSYSEKDRFFDALKTTNEANNLRAIYSFDYWDTFDFSIEDEKVLHDILLTLRCLRVLCLQGCIGSELPDSIGNLIHLRYLDLSHSVMIEYLPETICRLCNLETLLLKWCQNFTRLPTDLCKLIHLRHLDITGTNLREMPMQIGSLTSLQCLTDFMVGNQNGSAVIRELRELRDLRGTLSISNLQNVLNESDALKANLNNKKHLEKLNLAWGAEHTGDSQKEIEVLDNLQPHINLKHLTIGNYGGTRFPDWLGDRSFLNLKSLCLYGCSYCCKMPPLGQLPFLQNLTIEGMNSIVKVGSEFYGHDSAGRKPFQSLEILIFQNMPEWETWSILEAGEFCKLLELVIWNCPKLNCEFPKYLPYLKKLKIDGCKRFLTLDGLQNVTSLQSLHIHDCPNMVSIGEGGLPAPNLTEIYIESCKKLKALPERMCTLLPSLQTLRLCNLPEIEYSFLSGGLPSSLFSLTISYCDKLMARRMDWGLQEHDLIGNGICMPLMTILFGDLINSFGQNQTNSQVVRVVSKVALKFVYLAMGAGVAAFLQVACWMVTGERQAARIRSLYLKTILRQDIAFFDKETNTGEVVGRMSGDTVLIQDAMGEKVGKFIQLVSTFLGGFVIAFIKGWLLTLVMLSSIPPLVISGAIMSIIISRMASRGQDAYAKAATVVEQTIGSIRTVASFTGEKQAVTKYNKSLVNAYKSGVYEGLAAGLGLGAVMFIIFCSYALAVWYGATLILEKGYTGGAVINVIIAVLTGSMSLGQASPCMSAFAAGRAAAFKMFETISRKPEIDAYDTKGKILEDIRGDVELRDVYFSYPARPDEPIFSGFSLFIPSGSTAALVGQSGSGKSTVISLIERFYDPHAGEVLIDGINIKEFQLKWIRGKIGLVSQEPVLFASSIKDNIAYGKDGATVEEIRAAAELANAAKFIDKLPQGLDTMVGEHGTQLSGGQKQRVAIARAILKDPRILLLDEATSALDAESERVVQEALDRIMVNRTTVIVAHRLSTVRNADMIAVIHRGKMVEKGSHSELLKDANGAYSQLIRLQEVNKDSEQGGVDQDKSEISMETGRQSSQKMSFLRSISRGSSGAGNSSRHSLKVSFGLPTGLNVLEGALTEPEGPLSKPAERVAQVPLRRLAHLNKPEIPVLIVGAISAIINGAILPIFGILISSVIKTFFEPPSELKKDSRFWALMFVVLGVASLVAYPARTYFFAVAGCKLIRRIRTLCFEKVVHMEVGWFDKPEHSSGAIGSRLSADAATVRGLVGDALAQVVQDVASATAGLAIAFAASWQLALIILVLLPLIGANGFVQMKFLKGFSADAKMMYEEASQVANDAVGSIRTVASFCAEEKVMQLYKKKCDGPRKTGIRQGLVSGIGFGVSFALLFCVYALSFYAGARLVEDGKITFSDVFRVFFALTMAALAISQSSSFAPDSSKAKVATASIFAILDRKSEIDPSDESGQILENVKGEIELRHISFKYPTRPDIQIFRDLSLTIHSGKTVALVGESGSGKSTVISLLQRFYNPDSGHIKLDGIEIQKFQLKWLRQQMGLVSQEPILFNDTIRANIAYGKELGNATEAEILAASESANAHKFISGLQQGYDTMVGERGVQLSGGQKQRVAIARAIVKSPKILLLDEATSALDAESEKVVQDALDRVMVNRTTVVVAHRLSTIKNADVIAVVKNGVIVEKGKHDTLMNIKDGVYASLVSLHMSAS